MSCNDPLKHLQAELKVCLNNSSITPTQIVDTVRETLLAESNKARDIQRKATDALEALKTPYQYSVPDYLTFPGADSPITFENTTFPAAAYFDGLVGAEGQDTISLG